MKRKMSFKGTKSLIIIILLSSNYCFSQMLEENEGSKISGPEEVCAEAKEEYKFKHVMCNY